MSVIDSLIFDRTQADVDRVLELKRRILTDGLPSLTEGERQEYLAGMKGAYNCTDLNRVGEAIAHIAGRMQRLPAALQEYQAAVGVAPGGPYRLPWQPGQVQVSPKTDWTVQDVPTQAQMQRLLADLSALRALVPLEEAPPVPVSMDNLDYQTANGMEHLLFLIDAEITGIETAIYDKINRTVLAFAYAGVTISGE